MTALSLHKVAVLPAPSASKIWFLDEDSTNAKMFISNAAGNAMKEIGKKAVPSSTIALSISANAAIGSSTQFARADHVHNMEPSFVLPNGVTASTQVTTDETNKVATTKFVNDVVKSTIGLTAKIYPIVTTNATSSVKTLAQVGPGIALSPNKKLKIKYHLFSYSAATTTGMAFAPVIISGTVNTFVFNSSTQGASVAANVIIAHTLAQAYTGTAVTATSNAVTPNITFSISEGYIETGAAPCTLSLKIASEVAGSLVTLLSSSYIEIIDLSVTPLQAGLVSQYSVSFAYNATGVETVATAMTDVGINQLNSTIVNTKWVCPTTGVYDLFLSGRPELNNVNGGGYGFIAYGIKRNSESTYLSISETNMPVNVHVGLVVKLIELGVTLNAGDTLQMNQWFYGGSDAARFSNAHTAQFKAILRH